jgi:hypothetical protein
MPASAGKGLAYGEIPVSQLRAQPTGKPKGIGARESIAGIKSKFTEGTNVLSLETTTGKAAMKVGELGGCIGPMGKSETEGTYDAESYNRPAAGVFPIRAEKLVDAADGTTKLEITDAWFDARTRGMRLIGKSTLALKLHATLPGGMRILVGRDEHDGKKLVQFVVAEAKDTPAYLLAARRERLTRVTTDTTTQPLGMCSHHRVTIATGGAGESASFDLKVILPPLASGERSSVATELRAMSDWEKKVGAKDVRTREVRIALGVSQTSRDKDPVLSISTEWAGAENVERVYTEREATFHARGLFGPDSISELADDRTLF